jgi:hypothetical protein
MRACDKVGVGGMVSGVQSMREGGPSVGSARSRAVGQRDRGPSAAVAGRGDRGRARKREETLTHGTWYSTGAV